MTSLAKNANSILVKCNIEFFIKYNVIDILGLFGIFIDSVIRSAVTVICNSSHEEIDSIEDTSKENIEDNTSKIVMPKLKDFTNDVNIEPPVKDK